MGNRKKKKKEFLTQRPKLKGVEVDGHANEKD